MNKIEELKSCVHLYNSDIICVCETHLNSDIYDAEIALPGYAIVRRDRDFVIGGNKESEEQVTSGRGGSIIFIKDDINFDCIDWFNSCVSDSVAITIHSNAGRVNIACVYRAECHTENQLSTLNDSLVKLADSNEETVVFGDFNAPDVCWETGFVNAPHNTTNQSLLRQIKFMKTMQNCGYAWFITDNITRRRLVGGVVQESTLDQIFCTNESLIIDHNITAPLGKSDHLGICSDMNLYRPGEKLDIFEQKDKKLWGKIHDEQILQFSNSINWNYDGLKSNTSQDMWNELHGKLMTVVDIVPNNSKINSRPNWCNSTLNRNRKNKDKIWAVFDANPTPSNLNIALTCQKKYEDSEFNAKIKYEESITSNLKQNCKPFYSYLRSKRVLKTCIGSLNKNDGSLTSNESEAAEVLADAFSSVFVNEPAGPLPEECYSDVTDHESSVSEVIEISIDEVRSELEKLDISKSQGPDLVHPKLLKALACNNDFVTALTQLLQECASSGKIPLQWKEAHVVSLFKKGCKRDPLNYRPVSLTSIVCKIYERFIRRFILNIVESKIVACQHGFVEKKSCLSNLLESVETVLNVLDSGCPVDVFYLDFCKAFDSVPHYRLLTKMKSMGISGKLLDIVRDFLTGRTMRTNVGGHLSSVRRVLSGVPQGSVLGPLLFVIFINDLPVNLSGSAKLFADDLKMIVNANDLNEVQHDIGELEKWQNLWLMRFNPEKCKVLHLDFYDNPRNSYILNNVSIGVANTEKDLGVIANDSFQWDDQIKTCISKANKMIAWVTRNLINRDKKVLLNIYKTIVRPNLEYCAQLWSPVAAHGNWNLILLLEGVQRRFTRLVNGIGTLPYSERLEALNLTTLAERRLRGDLIETFKIVNNLVSYGRDIFCLGRSGRNILSKSRKFKSSSTKVNNLFKSSLSQRITHYWNRLPSHVKSSNDVNSFKIALEQYKFDNFDKEGHFWEVSYNVLQKIEGNNYLENKSRQNDYLRDNPKVAKRKGINLFGS